MCSTETFELKQAGGVLNINKRNGISKQLEDTGIVMILNPTLISDNLHAAKTNHTYRIWLPW